MAGRTTVHVSVSVCLRVCHMLYSVKDGVGFYLADPTARPDQSRHEWSRKKQLPQQRNWWAGEIDVKLVINMYWTWHRFKERVLSRKPLDFDAAASRAEFDTYWNHPLAEGMSGYRDLQQRKLDDAGLRLRNKAGRNCKGSWLIWNLQEWMSGRQSEPLGATCITKIWEIKKQTIFTFCLLDICVLGDVSLHSGDTSNNNHRTDTQNTNVAHYNKLQSSENSARRTSEKTSSRDLIQHAQNSKCDLLRQWQRDRGTDGEKWCRRRTFSQHPEPPGRRRHPLPGGKTLCHTGRQPVLTSVKATTLIASTDTWCCFAQSSEKCAREAEKTGRHKHAHTHTHTQSACTAEWGVDLILNHSSDSHNTFCLPTLTYKHLNKQGKLIAHRLFLKQNLTCMM